MAKVTVALLSWNQGAFVRESLESILSQDFADFDLIVIDNASTDASPQLIARALDTHDHSFRSRFIRNDCNVGINAALNQALRHADSDYFISFAADDVMHPNRLRHQTELFNSFPGSVGALASACRKIDSNGVEKELMLSPSYRNLEDQRRQLLRMRIPLAPATVFRTSDLVSLNGFDERSAVEDFDTFLRLTFVLGKEIRTDHQVVTHYRWHGQNNSSKSEVMKGVVPYSLARISDQRLSRAEKRFLKRTLVQAVDPSLPWESLVAALASTETVPTFRIRGLAIRVIFSTGLPVVNRLKATLAALAPRTSAKRVGH